MLKLSYALYISLTLLLLGDTSCALMAPREMMKNKTSKAATQAWQPPKGESERLARQLPSSPLLPTDNELSLAQLIALGLSNNPATHQAWSYAQAAACNLASAQSHHYPQGALSLTYDAHDKTPMLPKQPTHVQTLTPQLSLKMLLLDFGQTGASVLAASHALYAANWAHSQAIQKVLLSILQAYYRYAALEAIFEAKQEDLHDAGINVEATEQLYSAGILKQMDLLQVQAQLVKAQLELEKAGADSHVQFCALLTALGLPANLSFKVEKLPQEILHEQEPLRQIEGLLDIAQRQRPDLAQAHALYRQKQEEERASQRQAMPRVEAHALAAKTRYGGHKAPLSHDYTAGLGLTLPLFDGFLMHSQHRQAQHLASAAYDAALSKQLAVYSDVVTSSTTLEASRQRLKHSRRYLQYTKEVYQSVLVSYKQGLKTILDLLTAQSALTEARAEAITTHADLFAALASLSYALGVLDVDAASQGGYSAALHAGAHL